MKNNNVGKMIIAVLQNDDYRNVIDDLNEHSFYVTVLQSSGGFLKKSNATIMIGLNHEDLDEAIGVLKHYGRRMEMEYTPSPTTIGAGVPPLAMPAVPVPVSCGGIVIFVMDVAQYEKF